MVGVHARDVRHDERDPRPAPGELAVEVGAGQPRVEDVHPLPVQEPDEATEPAQVERPAHLQSVDGHPVVPEPSENGRGGRAGRVAAAHQGLVPLAVQPGRQVGDLGRGTRIAQGDHEVEHPALHK